MCIGQGKSYEVFADVKDLVDRLVRLELYMRPRGPP